MKKHLRDEAYDIAAGARIHSPPMTGIEAAIY